MWLHLPTNKCILFIPRSGSTSIRARIEGHYPNAAPWTPRTFEVPSGFTAFALIRNPVDRFISGCAKTGMSPNQALDMLGSLPERQSGIPPIGGPYVDVHLESLSTRGLTDEVLPHVQLFKFETGIDAFCAAVGFASLPHENESEIKPVLSDLERAAVANYYARDIEIWNGI